MYRAEYRSSGAQVVVLPMGGTTFSFMYIDFNGRDRTMVAQVGCSLARAGPAAATAAVANTSLETADAGATLQWMKFGTSPANGGMELYVARSSIRRSGDSARMWDLWDFKTRHAFEGKPFLSARNQYEYDCARGRRRMLGTTGFSGHMGQGTVVGSGDDLGAWEQVGTSGVLRDYWEVACKRQ
jgi:hypothetical protein